jgi:hypothetical protein
MDHPERDDARWLKTIVARKEDGDIALRADPMGGVWDHVRPRGFLEGLPATVQDRLVRSLPRGLVQGILRKRVAGFMPEKSS